MMHYIYTLSIIYMYFLSVIWWKYGSANYQAFDSSASVINKSKPYAPYVSVFCKPHPLINAFKSVAT